MPTKPRGRSRLLDVIQARQRAADTGRTLGARVRQAREQRGWSQPKLAEQVGVTRFRIGQIERGSGAGVPFDLWYALALVLKLPLRIELGRDPLAEPTDAGHLKVQELMLRLARQLGIARFFELPTRPTDPSLSVDVGWRDDTRRVLILNECWNTFGSVNAAVRSTHRKIAEAEQLANTLGGDGPAFHVASCWIVRDSRRNRELIARYPEVFATAFPGSSAGWVAALTDPARPVPSNPGLVWCDVHASRLVPWRKAAVATRASRPPLAPPPAPRRGRQS